MKTVSHTKSFEMPLPIAALFPTYNAVAYEKFMADGQQLLSKYFASRG